MDVCPPPPAYASVPLRLNCGSGITAGSFGPDNYYSSFAPAATTASIDIKGVSGAAPSLVYQTQNSSAATLTYTLPGFTPANVYVVRLHFAEIVLNASGQRKMNVSINGATVLAGFDIFATAGAKNRAVIQAFNATADGAGKITLAFAAQTGSACVSGIEVVLPALLPGDNPPPGWAGGVTPMSGGGSGGMGPTSADGVNLASGVYENNPGPDLDAYNPVGPSPVFARMYRSKNAAVGYASPGLTPGWTHNYDVRVLAKFGKTGPLLLSYPSGATEQWAVGARGAVGGSVTLTPPAGVPYLATGVPAAAASPNAWQSLTMQFSDESRWTFTPYATGTYLLTQISNIVGRSILLNYDTQGRLTSITDDANLRNPAVQATTLVALNYNYSSRLDSIVDAVHFVNYTYYGGILLASVSQLGDAAHQTPPAQWQYNYTAIQGMYFLSSVGITDPSGQNTAAFNQITYDINGRVQQIADANGNLKTYAYGASTQAQTLGGGATVDTFTQNFDSLNRDTGATDAAGKTESVFYDDPDNLYRPTRLTNRNNQTANMQYDPTYGNLLAVDAPSNGGRLGAQYTYDKSVFPMGRLSGAQVGGKTPTTMTYYANHTVVNVGGANITQPDGLVRQITSPRPGGGTVTTTYVYSALGNVLAITAPGPNGPVTSTFEYTQDGAYTQAEALGQPLKITDPLNHATHFRYDRRGNLTAMMDAIGRETDYTYNAADQVLSVQYPASYQTGNGRSYTLYSYAYTGGSLARTELYDESGALFRHVDRVAGKEDEDKSHVGSVENATRAYDPAYRLKTLTDGNRHSSGHSYDLKGNLTQFTNPLANLSTGFDTTQGVYDSDDNLTQLTDGKKQVFKYTLAADDSRLTDVVYPPSTLGTTHYDYDQYGRVTHRRDAAGDYTFTYDDLDNVLTTTTAYAGIPGQYAPPPPQTISYAYNPDGSRAAMTTPAGTFTYAYDDAGRMTSVTFPWGQTISYSYDAVNRLTQQQQTKFTTTYAYDALDNLLDLNQYTYSGSGQVSLARFGGTGGVTGGMRYDAAGNRVRMPSQMTLTGLPGGTGLSTWTYDNRAYQDVLIKENNTGYDYDAADNLTTIRGSNTNLSYNEDNQSYAISRTYDGNGNPTVYFASDANDRLTGFYIGSGFYNQYNGSYSLTARYGDDGLRAWKQLNNVNDSYNTNQFNKIYFLYDGTRVVCELNYSGKLLATYGYGATGLVQRFVPGNPSTYTAYTFDPMGNVVSRFSQSDYAVRALDLSFYDAYGLLNYYTVNQSYSSTQPPPDPVGYGGQWGNYTDVESGYVLMGYRYYDPTNCRFLTRDPLGSAGGVNLYAYCRNNPINRFDPLGLQDDGGPEGITLGSTTSLGTSLHRNVNKEMNRQIVKPIAGVVHTLAELHPGTPLAKAFTGKDNYANTLSTASRVGNGFMAAVIFMPSSGMGTVLEGQLARFLGRKGATVITDEAALTFYVRGSGKTVFDGQIGKLLYEVKSKLNTDTISVASNIRQWTKQMTAARNAGMNYRVFIKAKAIPSEYQAFFTTSGIKYTLIQ